VLRADRSRRCECRASGRRRRADRQRRHRHAVSGRQHARHQAVRCDRMHAHSPVWPRASLPQLIPARNNRQTCCCCNAHAVRVRNCECAKRPCSDCRFYDRSAAVNISCHDAGIPRTSMSSSTSTWPACSPRSRRSTRCSRCAQQALHPDEPSPRLRSVMAENAEHAGNAAIPELVRWSTHGTNTLLRHDTRNHCRCHHEMLSSARSSTEPTVLS